MNNELRRQLLGEKLFNRCQNPQGNPVTDQDLSNRLQYLNSRNCLTNCNEDDLANFCGLRQGQIRRECQTTVDNPLTRDCVDERNRFLEERLEGGCVICMEEFSDENPAVVFGPCGHTYHQACIEQLRDFRCPECRSGRFAIYERPADRNGARNDRNARDVQRQFYEEQKERFPRVEVPASARNIKISSLLEYVRRLNDIWDRAVVDHRNRTREYSAYADRIIRYLGAISTPRYFESIARNTVANEADDVAFLIVLICIEIRAHMIDSDLFEDFMQYLKRLSEFLIQPAYFDTYFDLFRDIQRGVRNAIKYFAIYNSTFSMELTQKGLVMRNNPIMDERDTYNWLREIADRYLENDLQKIRYFHELRDAFDVLN
jgi:hypothetical protein